MTIHLTCSQKLCRGLLSDVSGSIFQVTDTGRRLQRHGCCCGYRHPHPCSASRINLAYKVSKSKFPVKYLGHRGIPASCGPQPPFCRASTSWQCYLSLMVVLNLYCHAYFYKCSKWHSAIRVFSKICISIQNLPQLLKQCEENKYGPITGITNSQMAQD